MASIRLGVVSYKTLSGEIVKERREIIRTTDMARLLQIEKLGKISDYWIPLSVSHLHTTPKLIDGAWVGEERVLQVADWFYEKEMGGGA